MESLQLDRLYLNDKGRSLGGMGSLRRDARRHVTSSYDRFRRSLSSFVFSLNYTEHITDTHNRSIIKMLLHNPMSQAELIHDINEKGSAYSQDVAIAIAFSCRAKRFDEIEDAVCGKLTGLYLFSVPTFGKESLIQFLRRCPNIKSLTLADMDLINAEILCEIFTIGLLPNLEFLEVSYASDDGIEAMSSSPHLRTLVFRLPNRCISNDGFARLVKAGGAKDLVSIMVRIVPSVIAIMSMEGFLVDILYTHHMHNVTARFVNVQASVNRNNPSTTLTKGFLMETLPRFVSKQGNARDLECVALGHRTKPKANLKDVKRELPFASARLPLQDIKTKNNQLETSGVAN